MGFFRIFEKSSSISTHKIRIRTNVRGNPGSVPTAVTMVTFAFAFVSGNQNGFANFGFPVLDFFPVSDIES